MRHTHLRILATGFARVLQITSPEKRRGRTRPSKRGRGEDRVRAAPAVSRAMRSREHAHEHTGSAEAVRPSLRNGFTAYFVLSLVTGLVCHHRPREALASLKNLTPASGRQDHTTSPYATAPFVRAQKKRATTLPRPPHPAPTLVTTADAPCGTGRPHKPVICLRRQVNF